MARRLGSQPFPNSRNVKGGSAFSSRSIDEVKFVLGQGDFVFMAAKGSLRS